MALDFAKRQLKQDLRLFAIFQVRTYAAKTTDSLVSFSMTAVSFFSHAAILQDLESL